MLPEKYIKNKKGYKKLTLLHSNDMHGDFFEEVQGDDYIGGLSLLSGYVNQVRKTEEHVIYGIAGDMLQGSIIDNEYRGISTIDMMNMLNPDIVTLGNHEIDYGITHLLFLERCAHFPIINANLHINATNARLFKSHHIMQRDGMKILFIGIITNDVLSICPFDPLISSFISVEDAAGEIERICNSYRNVDIDFTVILTHIGLDQDIQLAEKINKDLGVDLIIGGHSHTLMEEPLCVNDILIAHAGHGTDQIGRFDIVVDTDNNCIHDYCWQTVPINQQTSIADKEMEVILSEYQKKVDTKYSQIITRMARPLFHQARNRETELGNLMADILVEGFGLNVFMLGSGSIRKERLDEIVTKGKLKEIFPYNDEVFCIWMTGEHLKNFIKAAVENYCRKETVEFYQFSKGMKVFYDPEEARVSKILYQEEPLDSSKLYTLGLQGYHYRNSQGITKMNLEELSGDRKPKILSTSIYDTIEEYFSTHSNMISQVEGRLISL